ncbi:transcription antiterminator LicT [Halolactibacillus alkaliphilus]|uniref:Transcription antiterminator LicT n=1 Tax=Halolactibacillus alkaliphilus TaxID=442899 RepID=A0A511WYU0_9BACI|nr:PRD domain-containing protein [Halolactibacillus alkaliphilus]GEN55853.1 transcription antiterminator LicT [Halolactibacillus alkaliphilus]GGN65915.1 transcription antiterminator LicT [Halolactibacillus alkaliphilus]SFO66457.1 transcriptional antiterminator, BglG family [Halolactibacillus alkaliphilus]
MKVKKIINNNIVQSTDEFGKDVLVIGKALGFKKKPGDAIDQTLIEKVYTSNKDMPTNKLTELLAKVELEHVQVANEIINFAKASLGKKLSENIYLTLTDHIDYAIERYQNGLPIKNALLWEIKRFYNHEFLIGKEALNIIDSKLGIKLPEDEAGFIALHIVNAELDMSKVSEVSEMTKIIQNILNIIKYHYKIDLDEYSLNYERFITHLKFFIHRLYRGVELESDKDAGFLFILKERYKEEYQCALKIREYIMKEFHRDLKEDEMIYLTIHIRRITQAGV